MRAAILDYGAGNLHSLAKAAKSSGVNVSITRIVADALDSDALLLPGVGAFGSAIAFLDPYRERIRAALGEGLPCLGICLGMQLLFDTSEEGAGRGLGVIGGKVRRLGAERVPQMDGTPSSLRAIHCFAPVDSRRPTLRTAMCASPSISRVSPHGRRMKTIASRPLCASATS